MESDNLYTPPKSDLAEQDRNEDTLQIPYVTNKVRILALVYFILELLLLVLWYFIDEYLPFELQQYKSIQDQLELTGKELILLGIAVSLLVVNILSNIALIFAKLWAKAAFLWTILGIYILAAFTGPYVEHAVLATVELLSTMVLGALILLLLFSNSKVEKIKS